MITTEIKGKHVVLRNPRDDEPAFIGKNRTECVAWATEQVEKGLVADPPESQTTKDPPEVKTPTKIKDEGFDTGMPVGELKKTKRPTKGDR